jgi:hypothetical protein
MPMKVSRTGSDKEERSIGIASGDSHLLKFHRNRTYLSSVCRSKKAARPVSTVNDGGPMVKSD